MTSEPSRAERLATGAARLSDGLLDFLVLGIAAWTAIYHVCLVLEIRAVTALIAWGVSLVLCAWLGFRRRDAEPSGTPSDAAGQWSRRRVALLLGGYAIGAAVSAAVYAFADARWAVVWLLLFLTAAAGAVVAYLRTTGRVRLDLAADGAQVWPGAVVAMVWAAGLAVFSLFLVRPDADDTQYVHQSTWIAEHGSFPLRDTLFSDQIFPAIIYPPLSSFEALIGALAGALAVSAAGATYLLVTPLATVLGVLAAWRLLRAWGSAWSGSRSQRPWCSCSWPPRSTGRSATCSWAASGRGRSSCSSSSSPCCSSCCRSTPSVPRGGASCFWPPAAQPVWGSPAAAPSSSWHWERAASHRSSSVP